MSETSKKLQKAKTFNIYAHSICFLFLFVAFQTSCGIAQRALVGYQHETANSTTPFQQIDGFKSTGVLYIFFALFNWVAPIVISLTNPKVSMVAGACTYTIYVATFIKPIAAVMWVSSAVIGCGAAVIWTAQGVFITENSDDQTLQKNSGIFWSFLQSAMIWGNLYIYYNFAGVEQITSEQRVPLYWIFTVCCAVGTFGLLFMKDISGLQPSKQQEEKKDFLENGAPAAEETEDTVTKCKRVFMEAVKLLQTKNMLIVILTFLYTGCHQTFWTGVYPPIIGGCKDFGSDSDRLAGVNGIVMGMGQVTGGLLFSIFPSLVKGKLTRSNIVIIGGVLHLVAFSLLYMNFGPTTPIDDKRLESLGLEKDIAGAYWSPSNYSISLVIAYLLGFGDSCFNTQVYSYLGWYYKKNSAPAFALFKSFQSIACAISFFYAGYWILTWQLVILAVMCVISVVSFVVLNGIVENEQNEETTGAQKSCCAS